MYSILRLHLHFKILTQGSLNPLASSATSSVCVTHPPPCSTHPSGPTVSQGRGRTLPRQTVTCRRPPLGDILHCGAERKSKSDVKTECIACRAPAWKGLTLCCPFLHIPLVLLPLLLLFLLGLFPHGRGGCPGGGGSGCRGKSPPSRGVGRGCLYLFFVGVLCPDVALDRVGEYLR